MMNRKWRFVLAGLSSVLVVSACSAPLFRSSPPATAKNVTFVIPIQVENFSKGAVLRISLWNAEQMEAAEQNGNCMVVYDARTGTETVQCPEGVEYQEAVPEELIIPVGDIDTSITVTSKSIRVGEPYRIQISGLSSDDCNSTSASVDGTADSETVTLENLAWMSTLMACP